METRIAELRARRKYKSRKHIDTEKGPSPAPQGERGVVLHGALR